MNLTHITRLAVGIAVVAVAVAAIALSLPYNGPGGPPAAAQGEPTPEATTNSLASDQPIPTESVGPSPSTMVNITPNVEVTPTPAINDALALSDGFWNRWVGPPNPGVLEEFEADSLADLSRRVDLIIRGRVTDIYVGEYWRTGPEDRPFPLVYLRVEIEEVLKGEPVSRSAGYVEVLLGSAGPEEVEDYQARQPAEDMLWFLMYGPDWDERVFEPQRSSELAPYAYFVFNFWQGILRDINAEVHVMQPDSMATDLGDDFFPLPLSGTEFEKVVEQVRALARSMPEASTTAP